MNHNLLDELEQVGSHLDKLVSKGVRITSLDANFSSKAEDDSSRGEVSLKFTWELDSNDNKTNED